MAHTAILPSSEMRSAAVRTIKADIQGLNYVQIPGAASAAAAAPDGSLWVLSNAPSGADKYIWHYSNGSWTNISGLASSLSVAPNGTLYAINSGGGAFAYASGIGTWTALGGGCRALTAAADNSLYVISNGSGTDGAIWQYAGGTWTQQPGSGTSIAAAWDPNAYGNPGGVIVPDGLWVINSAGSIYYLGNADYISLPGAASAIAPIIGGLFALGYPANANGNSLYYYDLANPGWKAEAGSGASISSDGKTLYIVSTSGAIYSSSVVAVPTPTPSPSPSPTPTPTPGPIVVSLKSLDFLALGSQNAQTFTVSQANASGVFSVNASNCTNIVSVSPASGAPPFTVTPVGAGECALAIGGDGGQTAILPISVTTSSVTVH